MDFTKKSKIHGVSKESVAFFSSISQKQTLL